MLHRYKLLHTSHSARKSSGLRAVRPSITFHSTRLFHTLQVVIYQFLLSGLNVIEPLMAYVNANVKVQQNTRVTPLHSLRRTADGLHQR